MQRLPITFPFAYLTQICYMFVGVFSVLLLKSIDYKNTEHDKPPPTNLFSAKLKYPCSCVPSFKGTPLYTQHMISFLGVPVLFLLWIPITISKLYAPMYILASSAPFLQQPYPKHFTIAKGISL